MTVNHTFTTPRHDDRRHKQTHPGKVCPLCSKAKRSNTNHFLSQCTYLPESDRWYMVKARQIRNILDDEVQSETEALDEQHFDGEVTTASRRVRTEQSPYINMFSNHHPVRIIVNSGATGNMVWLATARRIGARITDTSQSAGQADGSSQISVVRKTRFTPERSCTTCYFEWLVI